MGYLLTGLVGAFISILCIIIGIRFWDTDKEIDYRARMRAFILSSIVLLILCSYLIIEGIKNIE